MLNIFRRLLGGRIRPEPGGFYLNVQIRSDSPIRGIQIVTNDANNSLDQLQHADFTVIPSTHTRAIGG